MLVVQYPLRQRLRRVVTKHLYGSLDDDGAVVQIGSDKMYGAAMYLYPVVQGALVRVYPGVGGQQGRMDVDQPAAVTIDKLFGEDAHEACQHDDVGLVA